MNREHRFRAWDEEIEHFFYSDKQEDGYFFEFSEGALKGYAIREPRHSSDPMEPPEPYCDDYPVEQFTGLKDKNGVEIYEGDIMLWSIKQVGVWPGQDKPQVIEYPFVCGNAHLGEVIGNIHQNPELLGEKSCHG